METIKTQMKSKFLQVCTGISMVLVAGSLFVFSISRVSASAPERVPTPKDFMAQGSDKIGKYTISTCTLGGSAPEYSATIMDTETGKTVGYSCNAAHNWKWVKDPSQIPANPFN